jgi:hypothetical protein
MVTWQGATILHCVKQNRAEIYLISITIQWTGIHERKVRQTGEFPSIYTLMPGVVPWNGNYLSFGRNLIRVSKTARSVLIQMCCGFHVSSGRHWNNLLSCTLAVSFQVHQLNYLLAIFKASYTRRHHGRATRVARPCQQITSNKTVHTWWLWRLWKRCRTAGGGRTRFFEPPAWQRHHLSPLYYMKVFTRDATLSAARVFCEVCCSFKLSAKMSAEAELSNFDTERFTSQFFFHTL